MIKLIIVDDHKIFLDGIAFLLSAEENIKILSVENSAINALEKLESIKPDLIITDIAMPGMNGLEFIKILKRDYPTIKILVLSMFHNMQPIADIDGFLLKETDSDKLIEVINGIVLRDEKHFHDTANSENITFDRALLGKREKEIIQLLAKEHTTDEIAEKLFISKHTVEAHRKNILIKLNVKNVAGLIKMGIQLGIVE